MMKREAQFGKLFRHWLMQNKRPAAAFELKFADGHRLPFTDLQEHQANALLAAKKYHLLYKIPDDSRSVKPFDMVYLHKSEAYVVIRYPKLFVIIDIDIFLGEQKKSKDKSLTAARAIEIADTVVTI